MPVLSAAAVAEAFGLGVPTGQMVPVPGGFSHEVFRLTTTSGSYAVKRYSRFWGFWDRPEWLPRLEGSWAIERRAHKHGISMPEPVVVPGAAWPWLEFDVGDPEPAIVRVHRWVDGSRLPLPPVSPELAAQVGRTLFLLHQVGASAGPWAQVPRPVPPVDDWRIDAEWRERLRPLEPVLLAAANLLTAAVAESTDLVWSHRDVTPKNVLVTHAGCLVILDWDVGWRARPDWELTRAAFDFAGVQAGDPDRSIVQATVGAYGDRACRPKFTRTSFAGWALEETEWLAFNIGRAMGRRINSNTDSWRAKVEVERVLNNLPRLFEELDNWVSWLNSA